MATEHDLRAERGGGRVGSAVLLESPSAGLTLPATRGERRRLTSGERVPDEALIAEFSLRRPSPARVYDALLGGKDNYAPDKELVEQLELRVPSVACAAVENRRFLERAVRFLAGDAGVDQFIDVGCGLPPPPQHRPVHQIAQGVRPGARVVYVDNDPLVVVHARALMGTDPDTTAVVAADLRDPQSFLDHPATRRLIDCSRPVAVLCTAMLHCLPGDQAARAMTAVRGALPAGSYIALSHLVALPGLAEAIAIYRRRTGTGTPRSREQIAALFGDGELVAPGLVPLPCWRPEPSSDKAVSTSSWDARAGGRDSVTTDQHPLLAGVAVYGRPAAGSAAGPPRSARPCPG